MVVSLIYIFSIIKGWLVELSSKWLVVDEDILVVYFGFCYIIQVICK